MGDRSDSRYRVSEVKAQGKGRVVIAGSVNNDFEHLEKNNEPTVGTRWSPRAE